MFYKNGGLSKVTTHMEAFYPGVYGEKGGKGKGILLVIRDTSHHQASRSLAEFNKFFVMANSFVFSPVNSGRKWYLPKIKRFKSCIRGPASCSRCLMSLEKRPLKHTPMCRMKYDAKCSKCRRLSYIALKCDTKGLFQSPNPRRDLVSFRIYVRRGRWRNIYTHVNPSILLNIACLQLQLPPPKAQKGTFFPLSVSPFTT